ncbi:FAD-binding oxidoreductase [Streptacidiphilus sp. PB12-B1b]|uniref:FAD-binding oxidoreductase n=1 Tax=Streptacidiphilus sp. PB12-B1b TaxID=2705012 RepID=UPI0015FB2901|nr:FAD-binding oxidoreductase [Streptacidiphilus sp. PB12-B1b]QMU79647.1 FAD-binding oxidoreductase [Streptacidiphilus sp. PB12-B1b]
MGEKITSRRTVLRGAGVLTAAAAGLTACTGAKQAGASASGAGAGTVSSPAAASVSRSTSMTATPGPPKAADWAALNKDLDGLLLRPGDSRYNNARKLFQPQYDALAPSGVVYVDNAHDVATALAFARTYRLPVAARCGGHSYAGWSSGSGLVLDVSRLSGVSASSGHATIGAGARLIDVYTGLAGHGVTIPAGSCPTVGVTGLTLGGGIGVTGRAYGLTCDSLTGAEVVTADGSIRQVSAGRDADLLWALRGGGGGNFGVVTSLDFTTHAAPQCSYAFLSWPWSKAAQVIRSWQAWAPSAPDAMWADLHLLVWANGQYQLGTTVNYLGPESELRNLIDRLGTAPSSVSVHTAPYLQTMQVMAGVSGWSQAAAHLPGSLPGQNPAGRVTRESYGARSDIFNQPISSAGAAALVAAIERYPRTGPVGGSAGVAFDALGGAINRVGRNATAFVHRSGLFTAQYTANYPAGVTGGTAADRSWSWLDGVWSAMRPYASGEAYQNYVDPRLTGWEQAYYGSNAARLQSVKRTYDPGNLFHFPQSIPVG